MILHLFLSEAQPGVLPAVLRPIAFPLKQGRPQDEHSPPEAVHNRIPEDRLLRPWQP